MRFKQLGTGREVQLPRIIKMFI